MFQAAVKRTTDWLVQGGSIAEEDREVYEFGLDKLFSMLSNFLFAAGLGLLFGMFAQTAVFYATYIMIRIYAGGYHADRPLRCFLFGIGAIVPCLFVIHFQQAWKTPVVFCGLLGLCIAILVMLGPTGNKDKMLDELEKAVYGRRLLRNLAIITIAAITLLLLSFSYYASAVLCGMLLATVTVVVGKVKLLFQLHHNQAVPAGSRPMKSGTCQSDSSLRQSEDKTVRSFPITAKASESN